MFKVGDKVRVVNPQDNDEVYKVGNEGVICSVREDDIWPYRVWFEHLPHVITNAKGLPECGQLFSEIELELVE